jgi:hypothetical protein
MGVSFSILDSPAFLTLSPLARALGLTLSERQTDVGNVFTR